MTLDDDLEQTTLELTIKVNQKPYANPSYNFSEAFDINIGEEWEYIVPEDAFYDHDGNQTLMEWGDDCLEVLEFDENEGDP